MTDIQAGMTFVQDDPFFDVDQMPVSTSQGPVNLPILYYDTTCIQAFFLCEIDRVRAALLATPFDPGLVVGRRALVGVAFFEYRGTTVGAYNEAGLAIPVVPCGARRARWRDLLRDVESPQRQLGFHILHLPVTTALANAAGREIWGYPKFVTKIPFELDGARLNAEVRDPGSERPIVSLAGCMGPSVRTPTLSLLLYSRKGDDWLRTTVNARGTTRAASGGSVRLRIGSSRHAMAERLRALGLEWARPVMLARCTNFQSRLNAGVPLALPKRGAGGTASGSA